MSFRTWLYLGRLGLKNLWNNKVYTAASVFTMAACILLFGIFYIGAMNVDNMVRGTEEQIYVAVFFDGSTPPERVEAVGDLIRKRPEVVRTEYISADAAWAGFRDDYFGDGEVLDGIFAGDNPLADSNHYNVYVDRIEQQQGFADYVEGLEGVRKVTHSADTAQALLQVKSVATRLARASVGVLLLISILLIHNTLSVGIKAQEGKMRVMRLMGASAAFVRVPFLVEGLVMGMAGMCIPLALLFAGYRWGMELAASALQIYGGRVDLLPVSQVFPELVRASVILGVVTGVCGGASVMGKLNKVK